MTKPISKSHSGDELAGQEKLTKKSPGFFAVDLGAFRCAAVGGLNSAVAYLVMARGTGRDNRTTQWSANAIEQRTGMSRPNAKKAVEDLDTRGISRKLRDGKHPVRELALGHQIPGGPFTIQEQEVLAAIRAGEILNGELKALGTMFVARGLAKERDKGGGLLELDEIAISALTAPQPVWLPNALVDGAAGEVPPIELLRQTRNLSALLLLIELYAVQFLPNFGGVPRDMLQVKFDRAKIGERGPFVVWGFRPQQMMASYKLARLHLLGQSTKRNDGTQLDAGWDASFWLAVELLNSLGVTERVGMLLEGDDAEAEIIHPYAINGGEPAERELATAARTAAESMITPGQLNRYVRGEGYQCLVPIRAHITNATMVEVIRLKYRPHTGATAAWYAQMLQTTAEYSVRYRALGNDGAA